MVGTTTEKFASIERLASDDGAYYVVCARSGERPVRSPASGSRPAGRGGRPQATEQYRAALRRYDPRLPFYDPIVCQARAADANEFHRER